jgi:hypothetical protein
MDEFNDDLSANPFGRQRPRPRPQGANNPATKGNLPMSTQTNFPISKRRIRTQTVNTTNGSTTVQIQQPGNLYRLMGIAIVPATAAGVTANNTANINVTLIVNSDNVLENVSGTVLNPQTSGANEEYVKILRPVSGSDQIQLTIVDTQATSYDVMLYFDNPNPGT